MARSLKKGPFVDQHLLKKVEELNKGFEKKVIKERMSLRLIEAWEHDTRC